MTASTPESGNKTPPLNNEAKPGWQKRNLSPARGLFFLLVTVITLNNFDAVFGTVEHIVILGLEVAEELLDTILEHMGLGQGSSQMITAYTGVALFLVLLYKIITKFMAWCRWLKRLFIDYCEMYRYFFRRFLRDGRQEFIAWWKSMDWFARIIAAIGLIVFVIPLMIALSLGMGYLVSLFIM